MGQLLTIYGLDQIFDGAERISAIFLVDNCQEDDGDVRKRRVALDGGEHRPSVEVRHDHVERYCVRVQLAHQSKRLLTAVSERDGEALALEKTCDHVTHCAIVIGDHNQRSVAGNRRCGHPRRRLGRGSRVDAHNICR